jgi:hypothetical protein
MIQLLFVLRAVRRLDRIQFFDPAKARHRRGLTRLFGFGIAVTMSTGMCASYSSAQTKASEGAMGFGRELAKMSDMIQEPHRISLNGEAIWMSSSSTKTDMKIVLDRFEKICRENQGASADMWRQIEGNSDAAKGVPQDKNPLTVLRRDGSDEGLVLCLAKTAHQSPNGIQAGLDFARTNDLGHLGAVRYAYAKQKPGHGTQVVVAWTEDHFKLDSMFPKADGEEVPGTDSDLAPRPPGKSLRLLSAKLDGTPYGVRVYQSSAENAHEVFIYYDAEMRKRGFGHIVDPKDRDGGGRLYMKGGTMTVVQSQPDPNGGTIVTVGDMGGADFANAPKLAGNAVGAMKP